MADNNTITLFIKSVELGNGLKAAAAGLNEIKKGAESVARAGVALLTNFVAPFTAALSGAALIRFTKGAIDNADAMSKAAVKAGQTVENFSRLAHVADLSGVSTEQLVTSQKNLAEWMGKSGLTGRDLTQVFFEQIDAIAKTADAGERLRMTNERFGRAGQDLLPLFSQGAAAVREMMHEADLLGITIGPRFAGFSEQFNDNLSRIRGFVKGLFNRVAEGLLPSLVKLTDSITQWARENAQAIGNTVKQSVQTIVLAYQQGRLGELVSLILEVAIDAGFKRGMAAASATIKAALDGITSVDFFVFAAKAGRLLAQALMNAVKIPLDMLNAGFEVVSFGFYRQFIDTNIKAAAFVFDLYTKGFNAVWMQVAKASPLLAMTVKPLKFDPGAFKVTAKAALGIDSRDFATVFAEKQKESSAAIKDTLTYFDEQIEKSKELLTIGEIDEAQLTAKVSAYEKLKALTAEILAKGKETDGPDQSPLDKTNAAVDDLKAKLDDPALDNFFQRMSRGIRALTDEFNNMGASIANVLVNGIRSAIDSVSTGIWRVIDGTATWADIFREVGREIISGLIKIALQEIVLDNLKHGLAIAWAEFRSAIGWAEVEEDAAQKTTEVAQHTAAEGAKTGSTLFGSISRGAIRLGETIFHGIQEAIRTAAHFASETAQTAITLAESPIRIAATIAEAFPNLIKAAMKAASSVADIPYVGPILAIAAMASVIGAGVKYMGGFERGGVVRGGRGVIQVNESGTESVLNARATSMLGENFINDLNSGRLTVRDMDSFFGGLMETNMQSSAVRAESMQLRASMGGNMQSGSGSGAGSVNILVVDSRNSQAAREFIESHAGQVVVADAVRNQKMNIGIKS